MKIEGIAVVTGGASGIGAACCRELSARGAKVVVLDRDLARAEAVAKEVGGHARRADVADEKATEACAAAIEAEIGPVEVLVNSAGIIQVPVRPTELSMASYDDVIRVDQRGTYVACVAFGRHMLARRRGSIINIASVAGMRAVGVGRTGYGTSKAAVIGLTRQMAVELAEHGITANAVAPGPVDTPMTRVLHSPEFRQAYTNAIPMHRYGTVEEIAAAVGYLASDGAAYVTGIVIPVDGGFLASGAK